MMRLYVPRDAAALAVGADEVSLELEKVAASRGISIEIIRTGSRGLCWLEPMVEVATPEGRVAFGPGLVPPAVWDAARKSAPYVPTSSPVTNAPMLCPCAATRPRSVPGTQPSRSRVLRARRTLASLAPSGPAGRREAFLPSGSAACV